MKFVPQFHVLTHREMIGLLVDGDVDSTCGLIGDDLLAIDDGVGL